MFRKGNPYMPKCELCGNESPLKECKIKDEYGTRFRNICTKCILELGSEGKVELPKSSPEPDSTQNLIAASFNEEGIKNVLITTAPSFEGYRITSYHGIIFDETITGIGLKTTVKGLSDMFASLSGEQLYAVNQRISELKNELIDRMKIKTVAAGANAIIGFSFESTLPGSGAVMVSASGTAVRLEAKD